MTCVRKSIPALFCFSSLVGGPFVRAVDAAAVFQIVAVPRWVISERGPHHQVWRKETVVQTEFGLRTNVSSYTELATGLNVPQPDGSFVPANASFVITARGAEALQTAHRVVLAPDINVENAVQITLQDGVVLRSTPIGFGYFDPVTGANLILASVRSAMGWLIASNEVVYSNCFHGVRASIHCQNRLSGFSQSLVLHEQIPPPEAFGFSPRSRLELFTQFAPDTPAPTQTPRLLARENDPLARAMMVSPDFKDATLRFGRARLGAGRAFATDDGSVLRPIRATRASVGKWYGVIDGKNVLLEGVEFERIRNLLTNLPPPSYPGITNAAISTERALPIPRLAKVSDERIQRVASAAPKTRSPAQYALVVDYELISDSETDFTFHSGTFLLSGAVFLYGHTVFEGNAVLKHVYDSGLIVDSTIETRTSAYRPLVLTSFCDDSIGEVVAGSTGVPERYLWAMFIESELDRPMHDFASLTPAKR